MIFKHSVPILYSENVRRSIKYYIDVLGFDNKWEWGDPPTFGGVSKNAVEIFFCEKGQGNPGTWLSVMIDDVDTLHERVKAKGGKIFCAPADMEWGLREMVIEDPDGHKIRFGQSRPSQREKSTSDLPDEIRIVERLPSVIEFQQLVAAVKWGLRDEKLVRTSLDAPLFSAVAENRTNGQAVGCVLLLGDNASFYYVKDMMVDPAWQSKRIGEALMKSVMQWLEKNAAPNSLVGLYTGENLAPFYKSFGFTNSFGMCQRTGNPKIE